MNILKIIQQKHFLFSFCVFTLLLAVPHSGVSQTVICVTSSPSIYFGLDLKNFVISLGGDLYFGNRSNKYEAESKQSELFFSITPYIGMKLFLKRKDLAPYIVANFGKEIPLIVNAKGYSDNKQEEQETKDQNNDFQFRSAIGLEYFINNKISIGGEVGLSGYTGNYSSGDESWRYDFSYFSLYSYSRVTLNYYF